MRNLSVASADKLDNPALFLCFCVGAEAAGLGTGASFAGKLCLILDGVFGADVVAELVGLIVVGGLVAAVERRY